MSRSGGSLKSSSKSSQTTLQTGIHYPTVSHQLNCMAMIRVNRKEEQQPNKEKVKNRTLGNVEKIMDSHDGDV